MPGEIIENHCNAMENLKGYLCTSSNQRRFDVLKLGKSPAHQRASSTFSSLRQLATFSSEVLEGVFQRQSLDVKKHPSNSPWLQKQHHWLRKMWSWKAHPAALSHETLGLLPVLPPLSFWPWPSQRGRRMVAHRELRKELHRWHPGAARPVDQPQVAKARRLHS